MTEFQCTSLFPSLSPFLRLLTPVLLISDEMGQVNFRGICSGYVPYKFQIANTKNGSFGLNWDNLSLKNAVIPCYCQFLNESSNIQN